MAGADTASPLIESRADLIEAMERGSKPASEWRIGTEHEKHVFHTDPLRPVTYEGENGIRALLDGIEKETGWHPFYDGENPIGLRNNEVAGGIWRVGEQGQGKAALAAVRERDRIVHVPVRHDRRHRAEWLDVVYGG